MPIKGIVYKSDGTYEEKEFPTQEEIKRERDEKYNDTIWKHKIYGYKVRVTGWTEYLTTENSIRRKVYYDTDGYPNSHDMEEFDYLFERIDKCKYSSKELDKFKWEVVNNG